MANFNIDYLVVAGGGGGNYGGGGAGGYLTNVGGSAKVFNTSAVYTVTVGAGGSIPTPNGNYPAGPGGQSIISESGTDFAITDGGGGGASAGAGGGGGSGSGGGYSNSIGGVATGVGIGNNGGVGNGSCYGGGGGGAGETGDSATNGGNGGDGLENNITGTPTYYAGGGGSIRNVSCSGTPQGGLGGGGNGGTTTSGVAGTNGLGGGGGARTTGGSGIVILRYATADANYTTTGSTPTEDTTTIPGQTILSFTTVGTGTITFTTPPPPPFSGTKVTTPVTDFNKNNTEEGLKIPSGTSSNQPTGVDGMVRNDTTQSSKGSASAITYYNGTDWRYFENELNSFNTILYDGNSAATRDITGVGFKPDLVWIKNTNDSYFWHNLWDSVRGVDKGIFSNTTAAQDSQSSRGYLSAFQTDGFQLARGSVDSGNNNETGKEVVAWCWKGGGLINKAADFNGSGIIQSSISKTTLANNFSVSFWWKPDLMNTFQVPIGGLYDETPGIAYGWMIYQGSDNKMSLYWITSTSPNLSNYISNDVVLEKGNWYHVVVTKTSSSASIYVDKSSASSSPYQGNIFNIVYNTNPSFYIGKRNVSNNYANGIINQIRVFTSALSASQVTELYNETAADNSVLNYPNGAGCIAAYPLGENANDLSNTYNGTASNVTFGKPGYLTRNTEGTIESTVSTNVAAGFSIVNYTGNGSAGATVGHGIDTPELVIVKRLSGIENWAVYSAYSHPTVPQNYLLTLDNSSAAGLNSTRWNNTAPTNAVFSVGNSQAVNASANTYIAYCWHSVPGYSKVGSFVGTGLAGKKITLDFQPAWLMIKRSSTTGSWLVVDNKIDTASIKRNYIKMDSNSAELTATTGIVFESDGFSFTGGSFNQAGQTAIYLAFAAS